jgi:hypothetical protein
MRDMEGILLDASVGVTTQVPPWSHLPRLDCLALGGCAARAQRSGMTTHPELLPHGSGTPLPQVDPLRLAAAAYLARYKDASRVHTASDLRVYLA